MVGSSKNIFFPWHIWVAYGIVFHRFKKGKPLIFLTRRTENIRKYPILHVWYIYLHLGDFVRANVGKYSSTMEHMGYIYIYIHGWTWRWIMGDMGNWGPQFETNHPGWFWRHTAGSWTKHLRWIPSCHSGLDNHYHSFWNKIIWNEKVVWKTNITVGLVSHFNRGKSTMLNVGSWLVAGFAIVANFLQIILKPMYCLEGSLLWPKHERVFVLEKNNL